MTESLFGQVEAFAGAPILYINISFTPDPRSLFPGIELFLSWVLESRGERRAVQAYR